MPDLQGLHRNLEQHFGEKLRVVLAKGEVTVECAVEDLLGVCTALRDEAVFQFDQLMDVCGVDYLQYGVDEWCKEPATVTGFGRGVEDMTEACESRSENLGRLAVVYHLLSTVHNCRMRVRVFADHLQEPPRVPSVIGIWASADWFERETFDLYGILFEGHPDLRRILTDYGFVGHPFRKDFPLVGEVEMRYDAKQGRVVYEPVEIEERVLVPKVIREDNRYEEQSQQEDVA